MMINCDEPEPKPDSTPESESSDSAAPYCGVWDLLGILFYQCWIWYGVIFNWKRISFISGRTSSDRSDSSDNTEPLRNSGGKVSARGISFVSPDSHNY